MIYLFRLTVDADKNIALSFWFCCQILWRGWGSGGSMQNR
jgi:hypothetical protein